MFMDDSYLLAPECGVGGAGAHAEGERGESEGVVPPASDRQDLRAPAASDRQDLCASDASDPPKSSGPALCCSAEPASRCLARSARAFLLLSLDGPPILPSPPAGLAGCGGPHPRCPPSQCSLDALENQEKKYKLTGFYSIYMYIIKRDY